MMRRLRAMWVFARWFVPPAEPGEWTASDAAVWKQFLQTTTGKKLRAQMNAASAWQNEGAVMRATPHACGWAGGFRALSAWLLNLSATVPPQEDTDSGAAEGGEALTERYSP